MLTATFANLSERLSASLNASLNESPLTWGEDLSLAFSVFGAVAALSIATFWALSERSERKACQQQSSELSKSLLQLTEQHYRERVQAEERHLLAHDSSVRNVHESLERALLGKPRA